jgi:hypothetical protein
VDDKEPRCDQEDTPERVSDAVERERKQVQGVGQAWIVLRAVRRELPSEQSVDSDVTYRMQRDEQHAAD